MAKKKSSFQQETVKDYLTKSKEDFKKELEQRIKIGEELVSRTISTPIALGALKQDFIFWDNYNEELLKQAFNNPNNSYYNEYTATAYGIMVSSIGGDYYQPSLTEQVNEERSDISKYLTRLKQINQKVDLMQLSPDLQPVTDEEPKDISALQILENLFARFHKVAQSLRQRYNNRNTIIIDDEYDVQDLLRSLLKINFHDVREEDYSPSSAGSNSRVDFALKDEKIVIETKYTSATLKDKEIGAQLLIDIGRYRYHPDCKTLAVFVYDKGDFIVNKVGLKNDLEKMSTSDMKVKIFIEPK
jgi:hypothetical protein